MRLLRALAALLACSLLLPTAAPCAALAKGSSTLPCCASPAKKGHAASAVASPAAGCCSTATGEAHRQLAGTDRPPALGLAVALLTSPAMQSVARPSETPHHAAQASARHDILRL